MEVRIKCKKDILKSFSLWLPVALFALTFYGLAFMLLTVVILTYLLNFEQSVARQVGLVISPILLVISVYLCIKWLTNSLSSYQLSIKEEFLKVKGKAGWSTLDIEVPTNTMLEINIGLSASKSEKLTYFHGIIRDQVATRLNFIPVSGKPFKLDFAAKAFDNESLFEFLAFAKSKGIQTNVSV